MENLPARVPSSLLDDLVRLYTPHDTSEDLILELVISIQNEDVNLQEFAAYLALNS